MSSADWIHIGETALGFIVVLAVLQARFKDLRDAFLGHEAKDDRRFEQVDDKLGSVHGRIDRIIEQGGSYAADYDRRKSNVS